MLRQLDLQALLQVALRRALGQSGQPPSDIPPDDPGNPTVNFRGKKRSNAPERDGSRSAPG
jgi:hypothetical protein